MSNQAHEILVTVKNLTRKLENNLNAMVRAQAKVMELEEEISEARQALTNPELSMDLFNQFTRQGQSAHRRMATAKEKVEEAKAAHGTLALELTAVANDMCAVEQFPLISTVDFNKLNGLEDDQDTAVQSEEEAA